MHMAIPSAASPETRLIPLNKLRFDDRNARSASDDPARVQADGAAGGRTEDPLFEDDHVAILDPDLMEDLALQRLNVEAAKYGDAWKWTAAQTEFTWLDRQNHLVADIETRAEYTDDEAAALTEADGRIEQAHAWLDARERDFDSAECQAHRDVLAHEHARCVQIERARADRDAYSETARAHAGVVVALDRDGDLEIHRGLIRTEDAEAYRSARARERDSDGSGVDGTTTGSPNAPGAQPSPDAPHVPDHMPPGKRNGGWTDALRNDLRVMRTAAVRRVLARSPVVATDLIGFVLARIVGFGRPHTPYEPPILSIRKDHQGVYASDAMKASEPMKHLDPVPAVDLGWLAEPDAALAFRAYRALPDEDRASVLAHAVATLTVPRLADDRDVSAAQEEAVRGLDVDFPAELAAVGAMPFDPDLVWSRMSKALLLGAAAETLGDDWAGQRSGLKKADLVTATAAAFRPDPARDADVDAAATRWLPPGFVPEAAEPDVPDAATGSEATEGNDHPAEPAESVNETGDALPTEGTGNGAAGPAVDDGALPAFLGS